MRNEKFAMRKYSMIFAALVCIMLSAACNISDPSEIPPSIEGGYGKISINFTIEEMAARTVWPSTNFAKYEYTFTKAGAAGVERTPGADGSFLLEVGNYTVSVKAYTGIAESSPAATGVSSTFNVTAGPNPPVQVTLNAVGDGTQGEFSYNITYPAGASAVITLQKWPGLSDITLNPTVTNGKTEETLSVGTGSYLLTVKVTETGKSAGISEAVHIYPSLSTVYTKEFSAGDMIAE